METKNHARHHQTKSRVQLRCTSAKNIQSGNHAVLQYCYCCSKYNIEGDDNHFIVISDFQPVAFMAGLSHDLVNPMSGQHVVFDQVITNYHVPFMEYSLHLYQGFTHLL